MSRRFFPKTLFVRRHVDGENKAVWFSTAPSVREILGEDETDGELVGVYELASVERIHVTRTIGEGKRRR